MNKGVIRPALDSYAATLERKFDYDRSKAIGASEIGQCARRIFWEKRKRRPDDTLPDYNGRPRGASDYGAALRGRIMEDRFWVPAMRARYGRALRYAGARQRVFADGLLSATPDGIVIGAPWALRILGWKNLDAQFLVECKTVDPRINLLEEKREHAYQVQVQMGLIRKTTRYRPELAVVSYIDASFWHEIDEYVVEFRPEVFEAAEERAKTIYAAARGEDLPPEGWIAGGKECDYCPFWRTCGVSRRRVEERDEELDPQFVQELTDTCHLASAKRRIKDDAEAEFRASQEAVKELLRKKGRRRVPGVVNWYPVKGRTSYDMEGLLAEARKKKVDVDSFCEAGEPSDQLRILI